MFSLLETLRREPRAPDAPGPLRRDWILVAVLLIMGFFEAFFHQDVVWRWLSVILFVALALTLPWRRSYAFLATVLAFGATGLVHSISLSIGTQWIGLNSNFFLVLFPYALVRWASGREVLIGLIVIAVSVGLALVGDNLSWIEILGASLFLLFPAALGALARYQDSARRHNKEQVRLREREQLARELHDTVAHHVSAIAIQSQAGQAMAAARPEAPLEALKVIEEAASRTLTEMRTIIGALRDKDRAELTPSATLADIERLGRDAAFPLTVDIKLSGALDNLDTTLSSTLFRLAQEGVTNAVRHAQGAHSVIVSVHGDTDEVLLTVSDDGDPTMQPAATGLGLQGMAERVSLLGGSFSAAPGKSQGWVVEVTLPKRGMKK
ncbi:MAG: sensor histidine kinase [Acidiferrobacterales bacterium]|nr:sensor histidine kinase [Acidiferrobacterales bacterium]